MKKLHLILYAFLSIYTFSYSQTSILPGNISGTWTKTNSPYYIYGDVTIPNGEELIIEPGVRVEFQGNYWLKVVGGYIKALGSEEDNIIFAINDSIGFHDYESPTGGWQGIKFTAFGNKTDTSKFSFCQFSNVKKEGAIKITGGDFLIINSCLFENNYAGRGGGIFFSSYNNNSLTVINSTFKDNITGAYGYGGGILVDNNFDADKIIIRNNLFENNQSDWGGAIYISNGSATIENNICQGNISKKGGAICFSNSSSRLANNKLIANSGSNSGGGICIMSNSRPQLINNIIINNIAPIGAGISIEESDLTLIGNIITNNQGDNGGGFASYRAETNMINNTFSNNQGVYGGGLYLKESVTNIYNSIFWGNYATDGTQFYLYDNQSSPDIYNSLISGGVFDFGLGYSVVFQGESINTLESDPLFENPSSGYGVQADAPVADWTLNSLSPGINKGVSFISDIQFPEEDVYANPRIKYKNIDIGAVENMIPAITLSGTLNADTVIIADTLFVNGNIFIPDETTMTISAGAKVLFTGHFNIEVEGALVCKGTEKEGIYFSRLDSTGFSNILNLDGAWQGIKFDNGPNGAGGIMNDNDTSFFVYCNFQNVKNNNAQGCLMLNYYSKVKIEHCKIEQNTIIGNPGGRGGAGIYCYYSNPYINSSIIRNNYIFSTSSTSYGGGVHLVNSNPLIENCTIENNFAVSGAAIYMNHSDPVIRNSDIIFNRGGDGGAILAEYSEPVIRNTRLCNNSASGLGSVFDIRYGSLTLINCLMANNKSVITGGLRIYSNENFLLLNNTIVNSQP